MAKDKKPEKKADKTESTPKPEAKPEKKANEFKRTLGEWSKVKKVEGSGAGASIKFGIAPTTLQTEKEFDALIEKYRNAKTY